VGLPLQRALPGSVGVCGRRLVEGNRHLLRRARRAWNAVLDMGHVGGALAQLGIMVMPSLLHPHVPSSKGFWQRQLTFPSLLSDCFYLTLATTSQMLSDDGRHCASCGSAACMLAWPLGAVTQGPRLPPWHGCGRDPVTLSGRIWASDASHCHDSAPPPPTTYDDDAKHVAFETANARQHRLSPSVTTRLHNNWQASRRLDDIEKQDVESRAVRP